MAYIFRTPSSYLMRPIAGSPHCCICGLRISITARLPHMDSFITWFSLRMPMGRKHSPSPCRINIMVAAAFTAYVFLTQAAIRALVRYRTTLRILAFRRSPLYCDGLPPPLPVSFVFSRLPCILSARSLTTSSLVCPLLVWDYTCYHRVALLHAPRTPHYSHGFSRITVLSCLWVLQKGTFCLNLFSLSLTAFSLVWTRTIGLWLFKLNKATFAYRSCRAGRRTDTLANTRFAPPFWDSLGHPLVLVS